MENVFIDIAGKKINKLFWSTSVSLESIIEKLEDFMTETDALYEKLEQKEERIKELEEEIREIKADREENYTPKPINHYINLGLSESDFH